MTREREILNEICNQLAKAKDELQGFRVLLFGSRAIGTAKERSDFDIGVLGSTRLPLKTFYKISDLFDQIDTLYRIDWVDLYETSEPFRRNALKQSEVLYG